MNEAKRPGIETLSYIALLRKATQWLPGFSIVKISGSQIWHSVSFWNPWDGKKCGLIDWRVITNKMYW